MAGSGGRNAGYPQGPGQGHGNGPAHSGGAYSTVPQDGQGAPDSDGWGGFTPSSLDGKKKEPEKKPEGNSFSNLLHNDDDKKSPSIVDDASARGKKGGGASNGGQEGQGGQGSHGGHGRGRGSGDGHGKGSGDGSGRQRGGRAKSGAGDGHQPGAGHSSRRGPGSGKYSASDGSGDGLKAGSKATDKERSPYLYDRTGTDPSHRGVAQGTFRKAQGAQGGQGAGTWQGPSGYDARAAQSQHTIRGQLDRNGQERQKRQASSKASYVDGQGLGDGSRARSHDGTEWQPKQPDIKDKARVADLSDSSSEKARVSGAFGGGSQFAAKAPTAEEMTHAANRAAYGSAPSKLFAGMVKQDRDKMAANMSMRDVGAIEKFYGEEHFRSQRVRISDGPIAGRSRVTGRGEVAYGKFTTDDMRRVLGHSYISGDNRTGDVMADFQNNYGLAERYLQERGIDAAHISQRDIREALAAGKIRTPGGPKGDYLTLRGDVGNAFQRRQADDLVLVLREFQFYKKHQERLRSAAERYKNAKDLVADPTLKTTELSGAEKTVRGVAGGIAGGVLGVAQVGAQNGDATSDGINRLVGAMSATYSAGKVSVKLLKKGAAGAVKAPITLTQGVQKAALNAGRGVAKIGAKVSSAPARWQVMDEALGARSRAVSTGWRAMAKAKVDDLANTSFIGRRRRGIRRAARTVGRRVGGAAQEALARRFPGAARALGTAARFGRTATAPIRFVGNGIGRVLQGLGAIRKFIIGLLMPFFLFIGFIAIAMVFAALIPSSALGINEKFSKVTPDTEESAEMSNAQVMMDYIFSYHQAFYLNVFDASPDNMDTYKDEMDIPFLVRGMPKSWQEMHEEEETTFAYIDEYGNSLPHRQKGLKDRLDMIGYRGKWPATPYDLREAHGASYYGDGKSMAVNFTEEMAREADLDWGSFPDWKKTDDPEGYDLSHYWGAPVVDYYDEVVVESPKEYDDEGNFIGYEWGYRYRRFKVAVIGLSGLGLQGKSGYIGRYGDDCSGNASLIDDLTVDRMEGEYYTTYLYYKIDEDSEAYRSMPTKKNGHADAIFRYWGAYFSTEYPAENSEELFGDILAYEDADGDDKPLPLNGDTLYPKDHSKRSFYQQTYYSEYTKDGLLKINPDQAIPYDADPMYKAFLACAIAFTSNQTENESTIGNDAERVYPNDSMKKVIGFDKPNRHTWNDIKTPESSVFVKYAYNLFMKVMETSDLELKTTYSQTDEAMVSFDWEYLDGDTGEDFSENFSVPAFYAEPIVTIDIKNSGIQDMFMLDSQAIPSNEGELPAVTPEWARSIAKSDDGAYGEDYNFDWEKAWGSKDLWWQTDEDGNKVVDKDVATLIRQKRGLDYDLPSQRTMAQEAALIYYDMDRDTLETIMPGIKFPDYGEVTRNRKYNSSDIDAILADAMSGGFSDSTGDRPRSAADVKAKFPADQIGSRAYIAALASFYSTPQLGDGVPSKVMTTAFDCVGRFTYGWGGGHPVPASMVDLEIDELSRRYGSLDCSGFMSYLLYKSGVDAAYTPRTTYYFARQYEDVAYRLQKARQRYRSGDETWWQELNPGTIILRHSGTDGNHVVMYLGCFALSPDEDPSPQFVESTTHTRRDARTISGVQLSDSARIKNIMLNYTVARDPFYRG